MSGSPNTLLAQFAWDPAVVGTPPAAGRFVVVGMGGSHLAADLLAGALPELGLAVHHDYGLPPLPEGAAVIAVSHSGNTEETLDCAKLAHARGVPLAVLATGGALLEFARAQGIAHIVLPQSELPARACIGYHAVALLNLLGRTQALQMLREAALAPTLLQSPLASARESTLLIYASAKNAALAGYMKVEVNETARMPAFINTFPELNHNEMVATLGNAGAFRVVLLRDPSDDPRIAKRMDAFAELARERSVAVESMQLPAEPCARLMSVFVFAQELGAGLARERGVQADPLIEDFKKRIA